MAGDLIKQRHQRHQRIKVKSASMMMHPPQEVRHVDTSVRTTGLMGVKAAPGNEGGELVVFCIHDCHYVY